MRRALRIATGAVLALLAAFAVWIVARGRPADLPWTALDLGDAPGAFTGRKLAALGKAPAACRALLDRAGVRYDRVAPLAAGPSCGYTSALRLGPGGARQIALVPHEPPLACPVAAALAMWEWSVVQPAARQLLGSPVVRFEQLGSYNCRAIAGTSSWSQHATANALDVAGFELADGRHVTILADWRGRGPAATFLHRVRAGACPLFATVLSPDYNAAHRDHLHLDQADRGEWGWRSCR